jgi:FkbM family methyltransferase
MTSTEIDKDFYFRLQFTGSFLAHVFKAIFKQHHKDMHSILSNILKSDSIILDVGAHSGQYTKIFSKFAKQGAVIALEPGSYASRILRLSLFWRRLSNVLFFPVGLAASNGTDTLLTPIKKRNSVGFGLSHINSDYSEAISKRYRVKKDLITLTTLDTLQKQISLKRLDLIKMDIEGWELQALKGAEKTLLSLKPYLLIELHADHLKRAGDTLQSAWDYLLSLDYQPHFYNTKKKKFIPANNPESGDWWWLPKNKI